MAEPIACHVLSRPKRNLEGIADQNLLNDVLPIRQPGHCAHQRINLRMLAIHTADVKLWLPLEESGVRVDERPRYDEIGA